MQIDDTLVSLAEKAIRLNLSYFQCFLAQKAVSRVFKFTQDDIAAFLELRKKYFKNIYLHSSYFVNLADATRTYHPLLERELKLAQQLAFSHILFHAGSAAGARSKEKSIDALARILNDLLARDHGLKIILENTAHGGNAVGSDLKDFRALLKKIERPEKLKFCIDVGHAFLFGYDVVTESGQKQFINMVDDILGWNNVVLIHLNDTKEQIGARIDKHWATGEGTIGDEALKRFVLHPKIINIPVLLEVPTLPEEKQKQLLEKVAGWYPEEKE